MQRVLTALILAPLTIASILYLSPFSTVVLFTLALGVAAQEWMKLTHRSATTSTLLVAVLFLVAGGLYFTGIRQTFVLPILITTNVLWLIIAVYVVHAQITDRKELGGSVGELLKNPLVCLALLLGALLGAASLLYVDRLLLLLIFAVVWGADIGAYFTGKRWGQRKLAASISPGKSWEGVAGGILSSGLILFFATQWMILSHHQRAVLILLGMIAACTSVLGDLFESLLKRSGGFKDSGNILPGHGGILDRIDGLIAAIPIYSLGVFLWVSQI